MADDEKKIVNGFKIESCMSLPPSIKRGRKPGTKDSRKFDKRGRPRDRKAAQEAADAVRAKECGIKQAAHLFFDEHIGFKTRESERTDENKYAERFRDFVFMIVDELRNDPKFFHTYRELGKLHAEKMKNSNFRRLYYEKNFEKLKAQLKDLEII